MGLVVGEVEFVVVNSAELEIGFSQGFELCPSEGAANLFYGSVEGNLGSDRSPAKAMGNQSGHSFDFDFRLQILDLLT